MKKLLIILTLLFSVTVFSQEKKVDSVSMRVSFDGIKHNSNFLHITKKGDSLWVDKYYDKDGREYVKFSKVNDSIRNIILIQKTIERRKKMFNQKV